MSVNELKYKKVSGASWGDLYKEDDYLQLVVRTRTGGWPFATSISSSPYVVNTLMKYTPTATPCVTDEDCDDNNDCNEVETCGVNDVCEYSDPVVCEDNNICTTDTCDPSDGTCVFDLITCSDEDDITCTVGLCDAVFGCQ